MYLKMSGSSAFNWKLKSMRLICWAWASIHLCVCKWMNLWLFYAWLCVRVLPRREAGRHDVLWVVASLWGWPDLCLQLRFTGQQQMRGVIAWQQHSPSLGLMAHRMHTDAHMQHQVCRWGQAYLHTFMQICKLRLAAVWTWTDIDA